LFSQTIESATLKLNSHAKKTSLGDVLNVFRRSGFAMVILIVLMVLTRTQHFITVQHHSLVPTINSLVKTAVASTKVGLVITTMIAATDRMKESSVMHSTRRVRLRNLLARTSSASEINTDAVRVENYYQK
jgi:hypothetical protein